MFSGLEHLSEEDGKSILRKIKELMRHDSRLYLAVPNTHSLHRSIAWYAAIISKLSEHGER